MAINDRSYLSEHSVPESPAAYAYAARVRRAGAWLRNRAYGRFVASERSTWTENVWTAATCASWRFEDAAMRKCPGHPMNRPHA